MIIIRETTEHDLPMVTAIYAQAVQTGTASFEEDPPTLDVMTERWRARERAGYPDRVALDRDGVVIGYAYAGAYRSRPAYRFTVEHSVYVADGFQGNGVGKALVLAIVEACRERGFKQMIGVIGGKGHVASERLHEACGFERVGVLRDVGFKFGDWQDTVIMQRAL